MKKKVFTRLFIGMLILAGMLLILYPAVSNMLAERFHVAKIEDYDEIVAQMTEQAKEEEFQRAKEYNDALTGSSIKDPFIPESGAVLPDNYTSLLDFNDGLMGYIEIPKIDVYLPVYHGCSEKVLKKGIGHMENSAFPIGGEGSHAILTGHTGLPAANLFTDLDKLEPGDVFYITVLDTTIAYELDQILVVTPDNTSELLPVPGEDYVTLVTCTPYAINSHRLLVRGTRIPYTADEAEKAAENPFNWPVAIVASFVILSAAGLVVRKLVNRRKKRGKR